jgi:preprotein translocase subunit SecE
VVLAAVFAFGAYFFLIDNIIGKLIQRIYDTFTK